MEYKKLQAPSLKDLFIQEIEHKIISGELEIGEQLPTERELAEMMGINRNIVHSGIAAMVTKGFLEIRPRVGTFVADYNRVGSIEILVSMMTYNGGMLRRQEVRSDIELKILFDCFSIRRMANRVTQEQLDQLWAYLTELEKTQKVSEATKICYDFYHYMSTLSGNTLLPLIYNAFRDPNMVLVQRHIRLYGVRTSYNFMVQLFHYIANNETEKAVEHLTSYYERSLSGDMPIYSD